MEDRSSTFADKKVLENGFDRVWDFSEGLAPAMKTRESSDGLAVIEMSGKLGYIDHSGAFAISRQFVAGTPFENGIARVVSEGPCAYSNYDSFDPCSRMSSNAAPATGAAIGGRRSDGPPCK